MIQEAEKLAEQAFVALRQADQAGADTTALVKEFNGALSMLDEAKRRPADDKGALELAADAAGAFVVLQSEARELGGIALGQMGVWRLSVYASAPVVAAVASAASYFFARWWRRFDFERTLELEIEALA